MNHQILLCGFSGAGKSYLLKKMEENQDQSGWSFVDLDDLITETAGNSIDHIIEGSGWEYFRDLEERLLSECLLKKDTSIVISLGGGTLDSNYDFIRRHSNIRLVWLKIPFHTCFKRISQAGDRPLTKQGRLYLEDLYEKRVAIYEKSDTILREEVIANIKNVDELIGLLK